MIYDDQYNFFDIDLNLNLICNNLYIIVLVFTSMETANYLGVQHHHACVSCMGTVIPGREYIPAFQKVFNNMHDKCFNTLPNNLSSKMYINLYSCIKKKSIYFCDPLKSLLSCFIIIVSSEEIVQ
jgi:hypothetical protein